MQERRAVTHETVSQLRLLETCLSRINDLVIVTEAEPIDEPGPRILYVNDAFVRRTGYAREEVLGRSPRLLQGPDTDRVVLDRIHAAMKAWQPCRVELLNYTRAGEPFWIELDIVPIANDQGWYTHWVAVERDITARQQAASAVEESERMAQATLDALPSPVCVLDETGTVQATNLAWRAFSGANGGDPLLTCEGANYLRVCQDFARQHPEDGAQHTLVLQLERVLAGASEAFEMQYPCHSPTEARWFEARISRFPGSGPQRVAVVHLDVTGFKQAEQREAMQARVMTLLANDAPLGELLEAIVLGVEAENPTLICSVLLFDAARGRLMHGSAPSLPAFYVDAINGLTPGPAAGSCGTAAWRLERVIVEDIASDPLWHDYTEVALRAGLRACWSEPVRDSAGKLLGTFAIYHRTRRAPADSEIRLITLAARFAAVAIERKRDEAALQESEARFANAFEFAAVGVGLVSPDGRWIKVNRALCDMLGYSEADMLAKHFNDITHPDDRERSRLLVQQLQSGERDSFQIEKRYLHRLGRVVWVHVSVSQVRAADGRPLYEVCQVQDITAQKSAENERDMLFELSPDMLCVAYIDGRFKQVNPAWTHTLGWSTAELLEMSYLDLVHPADLQPTLDAGGQLREGRAVFDFENRYRCRDGGYRLLSWNSFPLPDVGVTFAVVRDITEHAAAEEARRIADQRAGERQRMEALGSLAGGIAHDFNNNLAVMLGNVTLARHALGQDSPVREKLAQIEIAGQRAAALVQQILAFSRRQPQQLRVQALGCIVTETLRLLRATIPAGIVLDLRIDDDAPPILADETQLHQILMNLCTNAWHAIEARRGQGGVIEVRVEGCEYEAQTTEPGDDAACERGVCLMVRDNGVGMDAPTRARLFEPFFTTRDIGEGTGLGMSVVHGIVAAHHGTISVDSTPGVGTTVRVSFPAATADAAAPEIAHAGAASVATTHDGGHVLYIDDEQQLVVLAREMLEEEGYTVTGLADAAEALAVVRANPHAFDLVITDFNMPVHSGFDIVREITTLRADLPVVVASGNITPAMQEEAGRLGVRRLLHKPDIATRLRPIVREVLGGGGR